MAERPIVPDCHRHGGVPPWRHKSGALIFMYKVYILKSLQNLKKYYIGHTHDLKNRLERHNKGLVRSTKAYGPWDIIYTENFDTKNDAYKRELQIKSYKGGEALKRLIGK